jgi:hypothetical protein
MDYTFDIKYSLDKYKLLHINKDNHDEYFFSNFNDIPTSILEWYIEQINDIIELTFQDYTFIIKKIVDSDTLRVDFTMPLTDEDNLMHNNYLVYQNYLNDNAEVFAEMASDPDDDSNYPVNINNILYIVQGSFSNLKKVL